MCDHPFIVQNVCCPGLRARCGLLQEAAANEPKDAEPRFKDAEPKDAEPKDDEPQDAEPQDAEPKDVELKSQSGTPDKKGEEIPRGANRSIDEAGPAAMNMKA